MVFIFALEYIIVALFVLFMFTQVFLPWALDLPLFPIFRWRRLNKMKAEVAEQIAQDEAEMKIRIMEDNLLRRRSQRVNVKADVPPDTQPVEESDAKDNSQ